jgi:UDP-N-acetylglucosamine--dolichyl-phosphate N-acetylglucosaminephosphotransferase|tara:strand:- start:1608 stop:2600 length:993 start_codon:yes stop_codon:yes gene_type:complete
MEPLLLVVIFASFLCTYLILPSWIKKANLNGLTGKDMHKKDKRKISECGGVAVLTGVSLGILSYIALNTFYFNNNEKLIYIFALLSVLFIASIVGIIDDLFGWKKGLSKRIRILIILFAAIPLMVINAGNSTMSIPFFGAINFGLLYPLIIIPIGVLGVITTFNFLAGYNGLEASQGIIILSALAIVTYITENAWLSVIALFMIGSLIAFYIFNKYPAKVFPGDILTYSIGALIASIVILGNIEKIAVFFFIPYIIEVVLKLRGKLEKQSFAKLNKDGSLEMPYKKIYGLEHLAIYILKKFKKNVFEKEVVYLINGFQILIIILGFLIFM